MVSFLAHVTPLDRILWKSVELIRVIVLTNKHSENITSLAEVTWQTLELQLIPVFRQLVDHKLDCRLPLTTFIQACGLMSISIYAIVEKMIMTGLNVV